MDFKRAPGKAPPVIKQRVILVPKGASGSTIKNNNTWPSSNARSIVKGPSRLDANNTSTTPSSSSSSVVKEPYRLNTNNINTNPSSSSRSVVKEPYRLNTNNTNIKPSSKPRFVTKEPYRATPASIHKAYRTPTPPLFTSTMSPSELMELYLQSGFSSHSRQSIRASQEGVSLRDVEEFDLTTLWGAREDAVEQLHASNALWSSPAPLFTPGPVEEFSMFESGDEFGWDAEQVNFLPVPQVENPPATPRLMVSLPIPKGFTPAPAIPAAPAVTAPTNKGANRPAAPPGPPPNAVYAEQSHPIPQAVQAVVDEILLRAATKSNKAGFPQRVDLRNMPSGVTDLDRRYGYITAGSELMKFYGDLRLFNEATWKYLVSSGKAV